MPVKPAVHVTKWTACRGGGRSFKCVACGHAGHADLNAARNILASGTGATAHGGILDGVWALPVSEAMPLKCEMDTKIALST